MNRIILLLSVFVFSSLITLSQDTIYTKNDKVISAKVLEVLPQEIKFKKYENPDGPLYTMKISEIKKIVYENDFEDTFEAIITVDEINNQKKRVALLMFHIGPTFATLYGDTEDTKIKSGFAGGFTIEMPIDFSSRNYFDFTFLYEQKGTRYNDFTFDDNGRIYEMSDISEQLEYFTLAGTLIRYFGNNKILFGKLGGYLGYLYRATLKGNVKATDNGQTENVDISVRNYYHAFDAGCSIGTGVRLTLIKGKYHTDFISEIRYNLGLSNIFHTFKSTQSLTDDPKEFNSNLLILFGLRFPF